MSSLLEKIAAAKPGQKPATFGLKPRAVRHGLLPKPAESAPLPKTGTSARAPKPGA